ncbi:MAG: alpha-amylase family glycosyl hydrolase [Ferruginibacter sp.]
MKKTLLSLWVLLLSFSSFAQLLSTTPTFITDASSNVPIVMNAAYGNRAFYNLTTQTYVHIGVITNLSTSNSDWRYVRPGNFNQAEASLITVVSGSVPNIRHTFTIPGTIRSYFGVPAGETILKIAILFRNADGSKVQRNADGSDMFIPVNDGTLDVRFSAPLFQPLYTPQPEPISVIAGGSLSLTAISNLSSTLRILLDGNQLATQSAVTTLSTTASALTAGYHTATAEATSGSTKTNAFTFFIPAATTVQALPSNVRNGINYETDQTAATLVVYAPGKTRMTVIGDLPGSNWQEQVSYQMKKTSDGNYFWIRLTGLTPGTEYSFQYLIDGNLKVGDAYTEKVLDPWNDPYITSTTYPGLKAYPTGLTTGVVSILQTAAPAYTWQTTGYTRPDKRNLMVYELLLRDFITNHDWNTMTDTLNYLKKLGINTIELMPINEFEGNTSWGYNPDYYFAPDKYYGPKNDLKRFIDMAHSKGIAVVMDIALNHSFGLSPLVQMYWDPTNNRPASTNPWFFTTARHPYNVGYDMNHGAAPTNYYFSRIVEHWLTEYKIDGFRFDLSKGFTTTNYCTTTNCDTDTEVGNWSNYDAGRIAIWKKYYDTLQLKSPGSYAILEHFATNSEEQELSNYGLMLWGNMNYNFSEAMMGWVGTSNFDNALHVTRGWSNPYLVSYMESHDEERLMYRNINYGNQGNASYDTRSLSVASARMGMNSAFLFTMPGPKMMWEFGEMAYDYSINYCISTGTTGDCRVDPKPIRWDYLQNTDRKKLHDVTAALLQIRSNPSYFEAFTTGFISRDFGNSSGFKWMTLNSGSGKVVVVGNFNVTAQTGSVTFPAAGTWYNYLASLNGGAATFTATGASQNITLQPGEYYVYLSTNVVLPVTLLNFSGRNNGSSNLLSWVTDNEINLDKYELQRSINGRDFETIGTVPANASRNYSFNDANISGSAVYYYRLKSVNADGTYTYSSIVRISGPVKSLSVIATPNPFGSELKLSVSSVNAQQGTLVLTDVAGKILLQQQISLQAGVNSVKVSQLPVLSAGTYLLTLTTPQEKTSTRLLKAAE